MRNTYGDREGRLRFLLSKMVDWTCCVGLEGLLEQKQMRMEGLLIDLHLQTAPFGTYFTEY